MNADLQTEGLIAFVSHNFMNAYFSRAVGWTEPQMLIDYDIEAAGNDVDAETQKLVRRTIHAAVVAFDKDIPFFDAINFFTRKIMSEFAENRKPKRHKNRHANSATIPPAHALD